MLRPEDVRALSDDQLASFAAAALDHAGRGDAYAPIWAAVADAVATVARARRTEWLLIEQELMNAGVLEGAIVEPGDDPAEEARQELREQPWWLLPDGESWPNGGSEM